MHCVSDSDSEQTLVGFQREQAIADEQIPSVRPADPA
jgi:hypothetical protein